MGEEGHDSLHFVLYIERGILIEVFLEIDDDDAMFSNFTQKKHHSKCKIGVQEE